ncbi:unnamed protein product [Penicillium salamii]|uniref:AAA+ ATPase domain-containing protein n=1 Tax=Penicillium salamii TaxID=1612424 RepID=A0A9W4ICU5_9EURO|nr:unnamed protein product [Penicillium salamii]CAG8169607.1 unnamed protein product [Penicillium salamii]CAG8201150.1 unnamed protein product [Penicillium salamii]CAG8215532.1 unnamed protein product [Penicillium salamii]CAG8232667.1 unnamed protein product [Penicillium salamii]
MAIVINESAKPAEQNGKEEAKEEVKFEPVGTVCDFRNLYQTKPDEDGNRSWTRDLPSDLPEPAEDADSAQYALLVRKEKCYDGRKSLSVHSIVVQSEHLKTFLGKVLDNYPGVTTTLDRLEFTAPFKPFVHRWEDIIRLRDEETDPTTKTHVDLFYRIVDEELRDVIDCKKDLVANGVITFPLAWTIMEPHDVVVSSVGGLLRGHQFDSMVLTKCGWRLYADHVEFDGSRFGYTSETFAIPTFTGTVPITSLPIFPLKYHPGKESIRQILAARGKRWEEHKGYHFKAYDGPAISRDYHEDDPNARDTKYHVKGRIIIDADAYNIFHPNGTINVDSNIEEDELTDTQLLLASPMIYGYSLKDKEWLIFYLESSHEITWDERAFESLVLPKEQQGLKEVILGVAKAQSKRLDSFDDVVQGKGRGIIMQLAGPPGVGKTLTAESVAEVMKVPLYVMSAGDLGMEASSVERSLKQILKAVPRWGAVLLLDEADVFMEARDARDLARNELVSIFLRMLEYYEGILFLTTNRAQNIDPAFESRIHISLNYQELDIASRRHIWSQFLTRSSEVFTDEQLDQMAEVPLNGRQIKNVIKTAGLLAWSKEVELGYEHLKTVLALRDL